MTHSGNVMKSVIPTLGRIVRARAAGPLLGLIALAILGAVLNPRFASPQNILNVLTRSSFIGIIAIGTTFVITAGGLDLSVGSMAAFLSGIMIIIMNQALTAFDSMLIVILAGMASAVVIGIAAGLLNGITVTKGGIEPFIVTLGTMGIFRSLVVYLADGGTISLDLSLRSAYRSVYYGQFLAIPIPVWVLAVSAIVGAVVLHKTRFGRYCAAIGSNENVARYSAINVTRIKLITYALQGLMVAIATLIYVPRLGSASGTTGLLWELEAIAAVIIGGTLLKGGVGRIGGTIIGAIMLSTIGNILNLTGAISSYLNGAVQGALIIIAVLLQRGNTSGFSGHAK